MGKTISGPEGTAGHEGTAGPEPGGLTEAMRGWSVQSSFYLQAVAERLGMGASDFACLTVLLQEGPLGAGAIGERSGLSSGAVTGLVDRLERAGWVRRSADRTDRRRVIVEPVRERAAELRPLLDPMLAAAHELHQPRTAAELASIEGYIRASTDLLGREVARLRAGQPGGAGAGPGQLPGGPGGWGGSAGPALVPRPDGFGGDASLLLSGLAAEIAVRAGALPDALCSLDFGAEQPPVALRGSQVVVARRRGRWLRGQSRGTVVLADDLVWAVDLRGGAANFDVDLRRLRLRSVDISGGASSIEVALPATGAPVPVRIRGGASKLVLTRPTGVPVTVTVRGGFGKVTVDGRMVGPMAGHSTVAGDDEAGAAGPGRYELDIRGGASDVTVGQA